MNVPPGPKRPHESPGRTTKRIRYLTMPLVIDTVTISPFFGTVG